MSARARCIATAAATARRCRAHGCWRIPGDTERYCKRHAQEIVAFTDDTRIVHANTGAVEFVEARRMRCRGRVGPPPEGLDAITRELRTVRCRSDWLRCRRAVFAQLDDLVDKRRDVDGLVYTAGLKPGLADAMYTARRRLVQIGEPS